MRVLVTGGTGFVGGHTVGVLLAAGVQVRLLVRDARRAARWSGHVELAHGDLRDGAALRAALGDVDAVLHLAALTWAPRPDQLWATNADGTRRLAEAAAEQGVRRVVYLSSYAAMGPAPPGGCRRTADPPAPLSAYGRSKLAGEQALAEIAAARGLAAVTLRAPAIYGPGDRALLPLFRLVQRGWAPYPAGEQRLQLLYVGDAAAALVRALSVAPGTYPLAGPEVVTWPEALRAIAAALGVRARLLRVPAALLRALGRMRPLLGRWLGPQVPFDRDKAEEMLASWVADPGEAAPVLPPATVTPLHQGLAATVEAYRNEGWL